jgi:hypothetical protein
MEPRTGFAAAFFGAEGRFGAGSRLGTDDCFEAVTRFGAATRRAAGGFVGFLAALAGVAGRRLAGAAFFRPEAATLREGTGRGEDLPRRAGWRRDARTGVAARFRADGVFFFRPGGRLARGRDGAFLAAMTCFPSARLTRVP